MIKVPNNSRLNQERSVLHEWFLTFKNISIYLVLLLRFKCSVQQFEEAVVRNLKYIKNERQLARTHHFSTAEEFKKYHKRYVRTLYVNIYVHCTVIMLQ